MDRKGWLETIRASMAPASFGAENEFKVEPGTSITLTIYGEGDDTYGEDGPSLKTRFSTASEHVLAIRQWGSSGDGENIKSVAWDKITSMNVLK